jgi:hypothetical protein
MESMRTLFGQVEALAVPRACAGLSLGDARLRPTAWTAQHQTPITAKPFPARLPQESSP